MRVGPLAIGWVRLMESDRITMGLPPWPRGWKAFCVDWRGRGLCLLAKRC